MKNNEHSFILGEHIDGSITYKFKLANHKYYILECRENEEDKIINQISNMTNAYEEWNKIKRPEKSKK